ncbi:MAG TPA: peptidase M28, partial [Massilia sp.]|nr:peptidase M28 [Massilia sp.]
MNRRTRLPALGLMAALFASSFSVPFATSAQAASPGNDPAALAKIRDAAMTSDYAWERTADMTDLIGPRLSGSAGAAAAVNQVADAMRKLGAKVTLQPVKVPHWVRGVETGELVDYKGRPDGITQRVVLT